MSNVLPDYLPGRFTIERGAYRHYRSLEPFHYRSGPPGNWDQIWIIRYEMERITHAYRRRETDGPITVRGDASQVTPVAIGVLSWPVAFVKQRNDHFGLSHAPVRQRLRFANDHVRTISRIIVHPQFRSIGLASFLIRHLCAHCPTRYVEALAVMGRVHPMFERAGMTRFEPSRPDGPVYYLFDRTPESPADSDEVHVNT